MTHDFSHLNNTQWYLRFPDLRQTGKGMWVMRPVEPSWETINGIGKRLKSVREGAQLRQDQLGERLGVSRTAIAKLERADANPTLGKIVQYAAACGFHTKIEFKAVPGEPLVKWSEC